MAWWDRELRAGWKGCIGSGGFLCWIGRDLRENENELGWQTFERQTANGKEREKKVKGRREGMSKEQGIELNCIELN